MEKRVSYVVFQSIKCVAKACDPLITKRKKVEEKIAKLQEEAEAYDAQIKSLEKGIHDMVGFRVEELVKKEITETGTDAKGKPIKTTRYIPTDIVRYDQPSKQYIITVPEEEKPQEPTYRTPVESAGSDFDIDKKGTTDEEIVDPFNDPEIF